MSRIFISYRREDTGMGVGRLTDALREHFASDQIFQDISSIAPGADFIEALQQALADCAAVLVVIGPKWLSVPDRLGRRRLDDIDDWVRQEIVEALGRPGLRVFPLLVDGAEMPAAGDLPDAIKPLARRQAYELTLRHWAKDISVLIETLKRIPSLATAAPLPEKAAGPTQRNEVSTQLEVPPPSPETGGVQISGAANSSARKGLAVAGIALAVGFGVWFAANPETDIVKKPPAVQPPPKFVASDQAATEPAQPAQAAQPAQHVPPAKASSATFTGEMVKLPAGCFEMGSPPGEEILVDHERQHRVCVDAFAIGKTEVTQAQWQSVMGKNLSIFKCAECPVEMVSWNDAMAFVAKLNASAGQRFRLPTEAEWEYACRGARPGERFCGGNKPDSVAWTEGNSGGHTHPVGQKGANGFGLHDMSGNVSEWTCSSKDEDYQGGERQCANNASKYVTRGGNWFINLLKARSARRSSNATDDRLFNLGFRLVRTLP